MLEPESWLEILHTLIANPSPQVQHRGTVIILNMINSSNEVAEKLFDTDIMQLLMGLTQLPDDSRAKARDVAKLCLAAAEKKKLIAKTDEIEKTDEALPNVVESPSIEEIVE